MSSEVKAAKGIYRDVEKLYRLYGLYNRSQEQLEQHVRIINQNFAQNFKGDQVAREWVQFDYLMSGVMFDGAEVFKAEQPEQTFGYLLFCEGVKALLLSKNVDAKDLLQWEARIRTFLDDQDIGKNQEADLASVLWKNPHPSIRVYLYNALLELADQEVGPEKAGEGQLLLEQGEEQQEEDKGVRGNVDWHDRDRDWELPSGELVYHQMIAAEDLKSDQIERLRAELADASVSDRARRILPFRAEEVEHLRQEMEMFDENHVHFNLLARYFGVIKRSSKLDPQRVGGILQALAKIAVSVVDRFHGGLILFYLKKLQELETIGAQAEVITKLRSYMKDSIRKPQNLALLSEALNEPARVKIAKQLIQYLDSKDLPTVFDSLINFERENGLKAFLSVVIEEFPEMEQEFLKWGEDRIVHLIPHMQKITWSNRPRFFSRCLRIRSSAILQALLPLIGELPMKVDEALSIFERISSSERRLFLEGLTSGRVLAEWSPFVRRSLQLAKWMESEEEIVGLWARVALRHLGGEAVEYLSRVTSARQFRFWPKFPRAREAILQVLVQTKDAPLKGRVSEIISREKALLFQSRDIRDRLEGYR